MANQFDYDQSNLGSNIELGLPFVRICPRQSRFRSVKLTLWYIKKYYFLAKKTYAQVSGGRNPVTLNQ